MTMYKIKRFNKCPSDGCIQKSKEEPGKWAVISGRSGREWKSKYDTKEKAEAALRAYFAGGKK